MCVVQEHSSTRPAGPLPQRPKKKEKVVRGKKKKKKGRRALVRPEAALEEKKKEQKAPLSLSCIFMCSRIQDNKKKGKKKGRSRIYGVGARKTRIQKGPDREESAKKGEKEAGGLHVCCYTSLYLVHCACACVCGGFLCPYTKDVEYRVAPREARVSRWEVVRA